ncbi:unnamed protein product [Penicillium salamii]|nr:unnamed protein product [Penicillium salamii]
MASPFVQTRCKFDQYQMNQQNPIQIASSFDQTYLDTKHQSLQGLERPSYDGRSPTTPKSSLALGTSESGSFPPQLIRTGLRARHQKALSNQWDGTPGSVQSYVESSPISSSVHQSHHTGISEILKSGKHASLPAKVDNHLPGGGGNLKSKEAKHRCRRSSHNLIERRRRDNINERIQDLSHLVPQHRLEDDKVRKQLVNTSALSMAGAGGNATNPRNDHRTIPGNIAMGLSIEWGRRDLRRATFSTGSGRRVPKHTNLAGDAVQGGDMSGLTPPSLSPSYRSSDSSAKGAGQSQHWKNADHAA